MLRSVIANLKNSHWIRFRSRLSNFHPLSPARVRNDLHFSVVKCNYYSNKNTESRFNFPVAAFGIVVADCMAKKKNDKDEPADRNSKLFEKSDK